jgi:hypothetical protein
MSAVDVIIIAAMEEEITPFLQRATSVGEPVRVGHSIQRNGELAGPNPLGVQGGIGLVNAAGAATAALLRATVKLAAPGPSMSVKPVVLLRSGRAELSVIVPVTEKLIVSPLCAAASALRNEPGPLSWRFVTVIVAA